MRMTNAVMRAAVHMTHACEATTLVSCEKTTFRHDDGEEIVDVYLFEICGHPRACQCYVWADILDQHVTIIPVVLRTPRVSTADRAVLTYRRKSIGKRSGQSQQVVPSANKRFAQ